MSLAQRKAEDPLARAGYLLRQLLWIPVHAAIEAAAVFYALVRPVASFHVVAKEVNQPVESRLAATSER